MGIWTKGTGNLLRIKEGETMRDSRKKKVRPKAKNVA